MAEEAVPGTGVAADGSPATGATSTGGEGGSSAGQATQTQTTQTLADTGSGGGQATQATAQQQVSLSGLRDWVKGQGLDPSGFADDEGLARALLQGHAQLQQVQPFLPAIQEYQQHKDQFTLWRAQQAQAAQQAAVARQPKSLLDRRPEYDPAWLNMVQRDPLTGRLVAADGAPPDVVQRLQNYAAWRREWQDALERDPEKALGPIIDKAVQERLQSGLGDYQQHQVSRQLVQQHADWMYARLPDGKTMMRGQDGRPVLSPAGQLAFRYVEEAVDMGITDPERQMAYAMKLVQADALIAQQSMGGIAANDAARKQGFINAAAAGHRPGFVQPGQNGNTGGDLKGLSLEEKLRKRFAQAGVTDNDVQL